MSRTKAVASIVGGWVAFSLLMWVVLTYPKVGIFLAGAYLVSIVSVLAYNTITED